MFNRPPPMQGHQTIHIVWVDTPRDYWTDTERARAGILAGLHWWEPLADVEFSTVESTMITSVDVLALNTCRDRSWLPESTYEPTFYIVAAEPTYRALDCDGVNIGDYDEMDKTRAIVWGYTEGNLLAEVIAHTVGHLYGAPDGPSRDIMDKNYFVQAYRDHVVVESTLRAIGAR